MAYQTLALGLTLTIPTTGSKNWGSTLLATTWTKISQHKHTGAGDGNQIDASSIAALAITGVQLAKNIYVAQAAVLIPVGTTQIIDFNLGNVQELNVGSASGDVTLTLSNPKTGGFYALFVTQGATPRNLIFPANVKWPQGQGPFLSIGNANVDKITLYYDGTNFFADWELNYS